MPKLEIDYSNTVFYKIYCKDPSVHDLYIGHTTNFVQRKHSHKQGCFNTKNTNYDCKLYKVIRMNNGWDNWKMEIIAFHDCDGLMEAKTYEQKYFEEYKATLNSIEPIPRPKPKIIKDVVKKEKQMLYCSTSNIYSGTIKQHEVHNKTKKHIKVALISDISNNIPKYADKFRCEPCDFTCSKHSDWCRHTMTHKHKTEINGNIGNKINAPVYTCNKCCKIFKTNSGLWKHDKKCLIKENITSSENFVLDTGIVNDKQTIMAILLQNQEIMTKLVEIMPKLSSQLSYNKNICNM